MFEFCHIDKDKRVLDFSCGFGVTDCFIVEKYDCEVVGIGISEEVIAKKRTRKRILRLGLCLRLECSYTLFRSNSFENV